MNAKIRAMLFRPHLDPNINRLLLSRIKLSWLPELALFLLCLDHNQQHFEIAFRFYRVGLVRWHCYRLFFV
jgi:hypothetical protein